MYQFTAYRLENMTLGAGEELSLEYKFVPDPNLEALDFWFSAWIFYNHTDEVFLHTVYNNTISLVEGGADSGFFSSTLFYILVIGAAAAGAYAFIQGGSKASSQVSSPMPSVGSLSLSAVLCMLQGQVEYGTSQKENVSVYTPSANAKVVKRSSSPRKRRK